LPAHADLDITATPDAGYEIQDWYVNGQPAGWGSINQQHFAFGNLDVTIHLEFQRLINLVHTTEGSHGALSPGGNDGAVPVGWGDNAVFTATPQPHFHVATWILDGSLAQTGGTSFTITAVTAERWLAATFAPDMYTVQASAGPHGGLSPSGATLVEYLDSQVFTATPDDNCEVAQWWLDGQPVQTNGTTFNLADVSADHVLRVTFASPELTLERTATRSVLLSWPAALDGWQLQENADLNPTTWVDVATPPDAVGARNQVSLAMLTGKRFYRLLKR